MQLSARHKEAQQEVLTGAVAAPVVSEKVTPRGFLTPQGEEQAGADADIHDDAWQQRNQQAPKQILRLVIKADVQGSMEAVTGMVRELAGERVDLKVRRDQRERISACS